MASAGHCVERKRKGKEHQHRDKRTIPEYPGRAERDNRKYNMYRKIVWYRVLEREREVQERAMERKTLPT
jgi:hypothetical protein